MLSCVDMARRAIRGPRRLLVCVPLAVCSCGGSAQQNGTRTSDGDVASEPGGAAALPEQALPEGALEATWRELGVAAANAGPALAATPTGFMALSQRSLGDARVPSAWESHLYRSTDGIRWDRVTVSADNDTLWLRGVAYGAGHYVLAGMRFRGGDGVIFHSTDGESWDEIPVVTGAPSGLADVVFSGGRFFALSTFRTLLTSSDGSNWRSVDLETTVMPLDVTFGQGQFLLVGSGDVQRSTDGLVWTPTPLDCALPGACISDPSGRVLQGLHSRAVFSEGTFFIDQATSTDGLTWAAAPGQYPLDEAGGQVIGSTASAALAIWSGGRAPRPLASIRYVESLSGAERSLRTRFNGALRPTEVGSESYPSDVAMPEQLEFPISGGADCTTKPCVVVSGHLYLLSSER
jgi:hypothetical protein